MRALDFTAISDLKSKLPGGEKPFEQFEWAGIAVGERADRGLLDEICLFC